MYDILMSNLVSGDKALGASHELLNYIEHEHMIFM